jgi:hypothetical protein
VGPTLSELRGKSFSALGTALAPVNPRIATILQEAAMRLESALVVVCAVAFAACSIKGPEVRVKPPIEVKVDGGDDRGGKFCPPGQAKKGRC